MTRQLKLPLEESPHAPGPGDRARKARSGSPADLRVPEQRHPHDRGSLTGSRPRHFGSEDWRMDETTRAAGRRGLAAAREALSELDSRRDCPERAFDAA